NDPITELVLARDINNNLRKPFKIELEDIDNDGRPDILASNQSDNYIDIFLNTTTGFSLSFRPTPVQVAIPDGKSARAMRLGDLNNDGLIDLVIGYDVSGLYVCENLSTTGNVKFRDPQLISSTDQSSIRNIEVGDFNGDGYSDLAASVLIQGSSVGELLLIKNATTSNGGNIQFSPLVKTTVSKGPWGITTGDIDGDGDIDILLAHAESNSIDLVINRSTSSTLNFNALALPTLKNSRNIKVADLNGDAKSDIAFISNSLSNQTDGFLSIFLNRNCVTPQITPATGEYCPGNSFILTATPGQGLTYDWKVNNVSVQNSASNTFDISAYSTDITVSVTTTSTDGKCIKSSATASYTVNMATPPTPPSFTASATQVCVGESIQLTSNVVADNYFWTGPDNFTGNTSSVTIPVDNAAKAGKYNLVVQNLNGCKSQAFTQTIEVFATPFPKIINNGLDNFCIGGSTILTTSSQNGFTLQWNKDGVAIPAATTTNLNVNATGIYTLTLTSNALTRCKETSPDYPINEVAPPVPTITTALDTCVNLARTFAGGISAGASQYGISYQWDFLDSNNTSLGTDSIQNATFTFATAGTYTAKLTTGYRDIANCTNTTTQSVTASAVPTISITSAATQKCRLDSMLLEIPAGMISYSWSTGSTTSSTYAKTLANQDTANVTSTIVTPLGCTVISTIQITNFTRPLDITSVDFNLLNDTLNIPAGTSKITLSATGGVNYRWSPSLIFDDSTATTVVVRPRSVVSYITLSATDDFGCDEQSFLYMENSNVQARKSFSPNGDGQGFDCWEILNSSLLSGCTVYVFNKQGRTIFQKDAPFENDCVWNGIDVNGNAAPEGIYYFVMKCEDTATSRTGTILLGR
ncbi:MAG: FG-GAP-like repeat-containing protein, partial [Cyclobacteriaceae bacterium]|nr:FG-GAP-like repeat-containing protein [Cyclobacteriaceae bacterium]